MFTYDATQLSTSRVMRLRFKMGDTVDPGFLSDEEVTYLTTQSTDDNVVAVSYCEAILNLLANEGTYDLGPLKVDNKAAAQHYTNMLTKFRSSLGTSVPYMAELRPSAFGVGMQNNNE